MHNLRRQIGNKLGHS